MKCQLQVESMPLSWRCEDVKDERGRSTQARTVARRVWGKDVGVAQWMLRAVDGKLELVCLRTMGVHQRFSPPEGYDSPWHSDCTERARQVAEWHEARDFNAVLDLCTIEREDVP